ncbi:MAG: hypothetical protein ACI4RG_06700, partial [Huintestinicola sp.]
MTLEDIFLKITMGSDIKMSAKPVDEKTQRELMEQVSGAVMAADAVSRMRNSGDGAEPESESDGGEE